MKTLRLTKADSIDYANGKRRFWRAMRKQPRTGPCTGLPHVYGVWLPKGWNLLHPMGEEAAIKDCPYGKPGDRLEIVMRDCPGAVQATITAITVEQRGGRWGWFVEVGA